MKVISDFSHLYEGANRIAQLKNPVTTNGSAFKHYWTRLNTDERKLIAETLGLSMSYMSKLCYTTNDLPIPLAIQLQVLTNNTLKFIQLCPETSKALAQIGVIDTDMVNSILNVGDTGTVTEKTNKLSPQTQSIIDNWDN
jgi:hypothetical protein